MIPANIDSIREKGMESIFDWFEQHKNSFYTLGRFYLDNQHQMEELFYRSILKVHKEFPRLKQETSFDKWVTSIFIQNCRELSQDTGSSQETEERKARPVFSEALDHLKDYEKEAMILRYVKGFSQEETAQILQVSVDQIKEYFFSGIRSLRKQMGYVLNIEGCKEYHKNYINYLERTMERPKRIDFEIHIYHCEKCQEDLATFQDVRLILLNLIDKLEDFHMPPRFMEGVKERLVELENQRSDKIKKRKKMGLVFAGVFALLLATGGFTGLFSNIYYTWTEENEELRTFLQQNLGQSVNQEAESDGVIVKIKGVVADDFQTLVFYEITDTKEGNQYAIHYGDGVDVENEFKIMKSDAYPRYYPPVLNSDVKQKEKNVYQGKISLLPLIKEKGTINLKISRIMKLNGQSNESNGYWAYDNSQYTSGEWSFEIPVTKQPSVEYTLDAQTEVEGIPVRFNKLTVAPTATVLQYGLNTTQTDKRLEFLHFKDLDVNNKIVKADLYGSYPVNFQQDMDWFTYQAHFDTLIGEEPKEVNVRLASAYLTFEDDKSIQLDVAKAYPQTFEYAGSTISIDKVEVGVPTTVVISDRKVENRAYESLHINIVGEDENTPTSMGMETEGVIVDKNGKQYDMRTDPIPYEEIEQPRHFTTVQTLRLDGSNVIPKRIDIFGYNTTKYLNDIVKLPLK